MNPPLAWIKNGCGRSTLPSNNKEPKALGEGKPVLLSVPLWIHSNFHSNFSPFSALVRACQECMSSPELTSTHKQPTGVKPGRNDQGGILQLPNRRQYIGHTARGQQTLALEMDVSAQLYFPQWQWWSTGSGSQKWNCLPSSDVLKAHQDRAVKNLH